MISDEALLNISYNQKGYNNRHIIRIIVVYFSSQDQAIIKIYDSFFQGADFMVLYDFYWKFSNLIPFSTLWG